ncbi:MAG: hypothetical protein Q8O89_00220 [Nanoarchaeota archaeon]|nr:hypothetical protein [Nanoarchaeota archaeon]
MASNLILMAGPCAVESEEQISRIADSIKSVGVDYLRGGAFKPRTSAGDWTGHGEKALKWMRAVGDKLELKIVTEIMDAGDIKMFQDYGVDLYQVGARNAQNQSLLFALGDAKVPVLLKNGMNSSLTEWLGSAGKAGDENSVMLCVRGKNNETDIARNGQDITALVHLVDNTPYKIIFDPSHITGKRELVYGVTMGAVATGVDGIIVEVHHDPIAAKTDGRQSITPKQLECLVKAANIQRQVYLDNIGLREGFSSSEIPMHVDIYFRESDLTNISDLITELTPKKYSSEKTGILTARIPTGALGVFRQRGYAIGEVVKYAPKEGKSSAEAIHITMPAGEKIKLTPFSLEALQFRGRETDVNFHGARVELAHGFAGQVIRDAYLTVDMNKVPSLSGAPLILYNVVKG